MGGEAEEKSARAGAGEVSVHGCAHRAACARIRLGFQARFLFLAARRRHSRSRPVVKSFRLATPNR